MKRSPSNARGVRVVVCGFAIAALAGCQRPPAPAATGEAGPPSVVHIDPKSAEGKELAVARSQPHENFVVAPAEAAPASPQPVVQPGAAPVTPSVSPPAAPPGPVAPMTPAPGAMAPGGSPVPAPAAPAVSTPPPAPAGYGPDPAQPEKVPPKLGTTGAEASRKAGQFGQGLIATPLGAMMYAKDKVKTFEADSALQLYVAEHGKPRNTAEYMEKVIKPNHLTLPALPEGQQYYFNPLEGPNGTLMIAMPEVKK
ncbi:MAG: hypothetical protein K8T25_10860 [Planctomycetia bacterium]|nr:hypothetical protein [Planctomycetia bacterium]